jgi:hypothetical protein
MLQLKVIPNSGNRKVGIGVGVTYRPVGPTCPQDCPLLEKGCYAKRGMTVFAAKASTDCDHDLRDLADSPSDLVRHCISGDAFKDDELDEEYVDGVIEFHDTHDIEGYMYTHRIKDWVDAGYSNGYNIPDNMTVVASVDSLEERRLAKLAGFKTARVIDEASEAVKGEVLCPFDKQVHDGVLVDDIKTTCENCRMCFGKEHKRLDIAFIKH